MNVMRVIFVYIRIVNFMARTISLSIAGGGRDNRRCSIESV
jgi:hypothetical protein